MSGVLLITNTLRGDGAGGRALLCKLNHDALQAIFGADLSLIELHKPGVKGIAGAMRALRGEIDGVNADSIGRVLEHISRASIREVFIDGSNLGEMARSIKRQAPNVSVISFFHNVEARFFWGSFRQNRTLRSFAVMLANYLAERKAVRSSDKVVCLSSRDSGLLGRLYGRTATHLAPMALQDRWPGTICPGNEQSEKFALFVGGVFYANQVGITWFVENVAPLIGMKTYVVGHGFEKFRSRLERPGKVVVVGSVASLASWYERAHVVLAPIFDGSGMKTKVAEALMFGKRIVGTPEAFSGYEEVATLAGDVCRDAADFAAALNRSADIPFRAFNPELRRVYEQKYSFAAAKARLQEVFEQ